MKFRKLHGSYHFGLNKLEAFRYFEPVNPSDHLAHQGKRFIREDFYNEMVTMFGEPIPLHTWWHGPDSFDYHSICFKNKSDAALFKLKYFGV